MGPREMIEEGARQLVVASHKAADGMRAERDAARSERDAARREVATLAADLAAVRAELVQAMADGCAECAAERTEMAAMRDAATARATKAEAERDAMRAERDTARQALDKSQLDHDEADRTNGTLMARARDLNEELAKAEKASDEAMLALSAARHERDEARDDLANVEASLAIERREAPPPAPLVALTADEVGALWDEHVARGSGYACWRNQGSARDTLVAFANACRAAASGALASADSGAWRVVDDGAFASPFGTVRKCRECDCLVAGGPTACGRCSAPAPAAPLPCPIEPHTLERWRTEGGKLAQGFVWLADRLAALEGRGQR